MTIFLLSADDNDRKRVEKKRSGKAREAVVSNVLECGKMTWHSSLCYTDDDRPHSLITLSPPSSYLETQLKELLKVGPLYFFESVECELEKIFGIWKREACVCTVNQRKIYNESSRQKQSIPITAYSPRVSIVIPLCVFGIIRVHCNQWVFTIISRQRPFVTNYSPFILSTIFSSFRVERNVSIRSSVFGNRQVTIEKRKILPR